MRTSPLRFADPPLEALRSTHAPFASMRGAAMKYPRLVTPFAALLEDSAQAVRDLRELMEPGEMTHVVHPGPLACDGLRTLLTLPTLQMTFPAGAPLPAEHDTGAAIEPLSCAHAAEMVALTDVAFPGFFRPRTCEMGQYFGIRGAAGRLVAMGGERMAVDEFRELSGLCTHPDFRGQRYAARLMARLMHAHRAAGLRSYLHVLSTNHTAIALYKRMGFVLRGEFHLQRVERTG